MFLLRALETLRHMRFCLHSSESKTGYRKVERSFMQTTALGADATDTSATLAVVGTFGREKHIRHSPRNI